MRSFLSLIFAFTLTIAPLAAPVFAQTDTRLSNSYLQSAKDDSFWGVGGLRIVSTYCPFGSLNCNNDKALSGVSGVTSTVLNLLGGVLALAAMVAVVALVVAGTRLVLAGGDEEAVKSAHKHIKWTLAGLFVVILSLVIVRNLTSVLYKSTSEDVNGRVLPLPQSAISGLTAEQAIATTDLTCPDGSQKTTLELERGYAASFAKFDTTSVQASQDSQTAFDTKYIKALGDARQLASTNGVGTEFENNVVFRAILIDAVMTLGDGAATELADFLAKVKEAIGKGDDATTAAPLWREAATIFAASNWGANTSHGSIGKNLLERYADDLATKGITAKQALIAQAKTNTAALASLCGVVSKAAPAATGQKVLGRVCDSIASCTQVCNTKPWPTGSDASIKNAANDIGKNSDGKFKVAGASEPYLTPEALVGLKKAGEIAQKKGYGLVVTSAYRSLENQIKLACDDISANGGKNLGTGIAWPGGSNHGTGTAVDIKLMDSSGNAITTAGNRSVQTSSPNTQTNVDLLQSIMTEAGWVRYCAEIWHFEFGASLGTNRSTKCAWPPK